MLKEKNFQEMLMNFFKQKNIQAIAEYKPPNVTIETKDRIDIYLPRKNTIIEIKRTNKFKEAIGQLHTYSQYMVLAKIPEPNKVLALFGHTTQSQSDTIRKVCKEENIQLLYFQVNIVLKDITKDEVLWQF